jgi:hypothetical protein
MLLKEAEKKYNIKYPELFRKAYRSGIIQWLEFEGKKLARAVYDLEKKKDAVFHGFYMRFIPFAEIENAIAVFNKSLESDLDYKRGLTELNTRYKYIPFARVGRDSRDYYMFVSDKENPKAAPVIAVYHTNEVVMYTCAVDFEDLMFQHLIWKVKNDRKCGVNPDVVKAYSAFLSERRADSALKCTDSDYDLLMKEYEDFLHTENGIILERQKFFPHLVPVEAAVDSDDSSGNETDISFPGKLIIDGRFQKMSVDFDDIRYIEADNKTSCIRLKRESLHCTKSFTFIEPLLPANKFFRCHKSFIVGFKHIITHCERSIIFDNGEKAMISKRKYVKFKEKYAEYLRERDYVMPEFQ